MYNLKFYITELSQAGFILHIKAVCMWPKVKVHKTNTEVK